MGQTRISVASLMGLVALAALGVMGMREGTPLWASAAFTVALLMLLGALVGAACGRGARRAFWVGFALFGWPYLALSFGPLATTGLGIPPPVLEPLLDLLRERAHPPPEMVPNPKVSGQPLVLNFLDNVPAMIPKPGTVIWSGNPTSFNQVGHALGSLAFGLVGGLWARRVHRQSERSGETPAPRAGA